MAELKYNMPIGPLLSKTTMIVRLKGMKRFKIRMHVAVLLVKMAGWILGVGRMEIEQEFE